jgi:hypothetical protein
MGGETANWYGLPNYFPNGTAAAPSITFASDTHKGLYSSGNNEVALSVNSISTYRWFTDEFNINVQTSALSFGTGRDLVLGREAAAVLQMGHDAAGVTNQMFKGPDRATSDGVGGNLTIAGGRNRGASAGGSLIFQTAPAAGAGVTGTLTTRLTIDSTGLSTFTGGINATGANAQALTITRATVQSGAMSGATLTLTNLIPAGSLVVGVTIHPTTAITSGDGATTYTVGDGTVANRWGTGIAFAADVTLANAVTLTPAIYPAATSVILTATAGTFSGGVVRVTVHYITLAAATS